MLGREGGRILALMEKVKTTFTTVAHLFLPHWVWACIYAAQHIQAKAMPFASRSHWVFSRAAASETDRRHAGLPLSPCTWVNILGCWDEQTM